jgi:hypothetical protein
MSFKSAIDNYADKRDETEAEAGGGDFEPLAEGRNARLRLVGYIELGKHPKVWEGKTKQENTVRLVFEVSGPKWPADEDGKYRTISFNLNKSMNEKATFYKLFMRLRDGDPKIKVFAQLLDKPFLGHITHNKKEDKTYANLRNADGWQIFPPFIDSLDEESGETVRKRVKVADATNKLQLLLWDNPDKEQWDSIFIDGEHPAKDGQPARSKNWLQLLVYKATNYKGSAIESLVEVGQDDEADDEVERPARGKAKPREDFSDDLDDEIPF